MGKAQEAAALTGPDKHEVRALVREAGKGREAAAAADTFSPLWRQVWVTAGAVMATTSSGMTTGYSAVLLPQLRNSTITLTSEQESWIASMAPLPMALGCLLGGVLADRLGRQRSQIFICVPFAVGWVLLAVARDLYAILAGRFLTGLCVGLVGPPAGIYIGETAGPEHRGLLMAAISLAVSLGILAAHVLGTALHWRLTAWLSTAVPIMAMGVLFTSPESPSWLASKGKLAEASRAFRWLRGYGDAATLELQALLAKHGAAPGGLEAGDGAQPKAQLAAAASAASPSALPLHRQLLHRSFLKPFFIISTFFLAMQFSGVNAVAFYSVSIIKDVGGGMDEYAVTIILDVVRFAMSCAACVLLRRVGRRPLAVLSAVVTGLSLTGLAALLTFGDPARSPWLSIGLLVLYITAVSLGLVPLPWVMSGEVFPARLRGVGGGTTNALAFFFLFSVVKTAPALLRTLTPAGAFGAYGCVALVGSVFLYAFLPETKNRTLEEIEEEMSGSTKKADKGEKKPSAIELP